MTTNFTFRDFFVYLLAGLILLISLGVIFLNDIFKMAVVLFEKYEFIKDFSFLAIIFLVPAIYLIGNLIGALSYNLLQLYVFIDKYFKKSGPHMPKWKYFILIKFQQLLYRQGVAYAIVEFIKSDSNNKPFKNVDEFWTTCAKLQIDKIYAPAEYWYVLNELFNSINLIFLISTILSFLTGQWILGIVYFSLIIFAFKRAKQYADHFIQTVCRLTTARLSTQLGK